MTCTGSRAHCSSRLLTDGGQLPISVAVPRQKSSLFQPSPRSRQHSVSPVVREKSCPSHHLGSRGERNVRFQDNGWAEHCLRQQCEEKRSKLRLPYVFGWIATPAYHSVNRSCACAKDPDGLRIARRWLSDGPYRCRWYSQRELRLSLRADAIETGDCPSSLCGRHHVGTATSLCSWPPLCGAYAANSLSSRRPTSAHARSSRS